MHCKIEFLYITLNTYSKYSQYSPNLPNSQDVISDQQMVSLFHLPFQYLSRYSVFLLGFITNQSFENQKRVTWEDIHLCHYLRKILLSTPIVQHYCIIQILSLHHFISTFASTSLYQSQSNWSSADFACTTASQADRLSQHEQGHFYYT